jgi:glutathione S-transferase
MLTLYDAPRCPYCARVRIVLAEKEIAYETVIVDLDDRPDWIYALNPTGRVPVLEEEGVVLAESRVLMEYLEERFPQPPLLPTDPRDRASVRLWLERFDYLLGEVYYGLRRERSSPEARAALETALAGLDTVLADQPYLSGETYGLADCGYAPWLFRAEASLGVDVRSRPALANWLDRLEQRPAVAAELAVVAAGT